MLNIINSRLNKYVVVFIILNLFDCILTSILLSKGGIELNHWRYYNVWYKMIVVLGVVLLLGHKKDIMKFATIGMGIIVIWNLSMLGLV